MLTILPGDCLARLRELPDESVHCCVTSPPYWNLRNYQVDGQLGLEKTPDEYVAKMVKVFREVRRVLRKDSTCWVNLGDCYGNGSLRRNDAGRNIGGRGGNKNGSGNPGPQGKIESKTGLKPKDLVGVPWRMAFALQADGWYLRSDIIWHKPNPMPESVTDRPTKAHEYIFLLSKNASYFYDAEAIKEQSSPDSHMRAAKGYEHAFASQFRGSPTDKRFPNGKKIPGVTPKSAEPGSGTKANSSFHAACVDLVPLRNKRSVWTVPSAPYSEAHFATYPPDLIKPCILAGSSARGCCPKCGAPWERVVKKGDLVRVSHSGPGMYRGDANRDPANRKDKMPVPGMAYETATLGWRPTCKCGEPQTVPCTVLDPFAGSGTTGAVSLELGRRAILIELNPQYVELIKRRCAVTPGLQLA